MNDVSLGELTNEISEHWFASGVYLPRIIKLKINILLFLGIFYFKKETYCSHFVRPSVRSIKNSETSGRLKIFLF